MCLCASLRSVMCAVKKSRAQAAPLLAFVPRACRSHWPLCHRPTPNDGPALCALILWRALVPAVPVPAPESRWHQKGHTVRVQQQTLNPLALWWLSISLALPCLCVRLLSPLSGVKDPFLSPPSPAQRQPSSLFSLQLF